MVVDRTRSDSQRAALDAFRHWTGRTPTLTPHIIKSASRADVFHLSMAGATSIAAMRFTSLRTASRRHGQHIIYWLGRLTPKSTAGTRHPQHQDGNEYEAD